ncbi:hypothetical protein RRG08_020583 [Elysia crispata]|uniref:Uncharacterized protein n=1 Tax=Elysia crispata TaxID=231223 RepID=A0AAE1DTA0_9GAST|nr:hypothetical protein RRG08_020583 [Elysia crispata]
MIFGVRGRKIRKMNILIGIWLLYNNSTLSTYTSLTDVVSDTCCQQLPLTESAPHTDRQQKWVLLPQIRHNRQAERVIFPQFHGRPSFNSSSSS